MTSSRQSRKRNVPVFSYLKIVSKYILDSYNLWHKAFDIKFPFIIYKQSTLEKINRASPSCKTRSMCCLSNGNNSPARTHMHFLQPRRQVKFFHLGLVYPRPVPQSGPVPARDRPAPWGGFRPVCFGGERWGKLKFNRTCRAVMRRRRQHFTFSNHRIRSMYTFGCEKPNLLTFQLVLWMCVLFRGLILRCWKCLLFYLLGLGYSFFFDEKVMRDVCTMYMKVFFFSKYE